MARRRLIVTAPRGSGGAYAHLTAVLPRIRSLRPDWDVSLFTTRDVIDGAFGGEAEPWMTVLPGRGIGGRLRWEFFDLPHLLAADRDALVYSPFGPPINVSLAPRVVWMSRNIIPLLPLETWEVSESDRNRLLATRLLVVAFAKHARASICVSEHGRQGLALLAGINPERIAVVPHGIAHPKEGSGSNPVADRLSGRPFLLSVGQPVRYRRTRELARAYTLLADRRSDLPPLVLVGRARAEDVAYERECLALLEPLLSSGRALVVGQLSNADTRAMMQASHWFLYPSVHEDCPNVVLEALEARTASILADIPAAREIAGDAAVYVRDPAPLQLMRAMEQAVFDQQLQGRMRRAAGDRSALFTWDLTAQRTAQLLEQAFSKASIS